MALVQLDRPWGTIVDDDGGAADNEFHVSAKKFQVAAGPLSTGTAAPGSNDATAEQQLQAAQQLKPQIVQLGQASRSHVSCILEGSMDSYTM